MDRLTYPILRDSENQAYDSKYSRETLLHRLAAYEDTGMTPTDIARLTRDNAILRNELCLKCGRYKMAHEGSCDGCRWHKKGE